MSHSDPTSPTEEELAAILAAVDAVWQQSGTGAMRDPTPSTAWRFSGRWWARPLVARRDRPWKW